MARARAIETRLEKLSPSLDEYFTTGFLTRAEVTEVFRKRTHWEYRLVAKPLLFLDVQNAIRYELELEEKLRRYCHSTKVTLRNRWSIIERVEYIYRIGLKHLKDKKDKENTRKSLVLFLKQYQRHGALSKLYAEMMVQFPTRSDIWVEAALYEAVEQHKTDNARVVVQQALVTMSGDASVWNAALMIELHFVRRLLDGLVEEHREAMRKRKEETAKSGATFEVEPTSLLASRLREENSGMSSILLDLALARAVVEEALASPACSPALLKHMIATACEYPFAKEIVSTVVEGCVRRMYDVFYREDSSHTQKLRSQWKESISVVLRSYLLLEDMVHRPVLLRNPTEYLATANDPVASSVAPADKLMVAAAGAVTLLAFAAISPATLQTVTVGEVEATARMLGEALPDFLDVLVHYRTAGVSRLCLALLQSQPFDQTQAARWLLGVGKLSKTQTAVCVSAAQSRVASLVSFAEDAAASQGPTAKKSRRVEGEATVSGGIHWPVQALCHFLSVEDRHALQGATSISSHAGASGPLTAEAMELFLVWWRQEDASENDPAARRAAAVELLASHGLLPHASAAVPSEGVSREALLKLLQSLRYTHGRSPICLWRLYNALEVMDGCRPLETAAPIADRDSSDSDEEEVKENGVKTISSFALAGLRFLAGAPHGQLSRTEEWNRVTGVSAIMRSRLHSWTGLRRGTRLEISRWMLSAPAATVAACVADMEVQMAALRQCQPVPRLCQAEVVLPFLEATVLHMPKDATAIGRTREAYEQLMQLYSQTEALDVFLPVQYDGVVKSVEELKARRATAESSNVEDWLSYIRFERQVARDLRKAGTITERARRLCLNPQLLLVKLNNCS